MSQSASLSGGGSVTFPITPAEGGTGITSYTIGDTLYASGVTTLSKLPIGSEGQVLAVTAGIPAWSNAGSGTVASVVGTANRITSSGGINPIIDISVTYVGQTSITTLGTVATGTWAATTIGVTVGGTGLTSATQGDLVYGSAANTYSLLAKNTNSSRYLSNTGASNNPAWAQVDLTNGVTGALPIANAGTNITTYATGDLLYASASNTLSKLAISTSPGRQLLTDGSIPRWFNPITDIFLLDDLISAGGTTAGNTNYIFNTQNSAGTARTGTLNHPGVIQLQTGVNTNGAIGMSHGNTIIASSGRILLNFVAKIDTLSDGTDTYTLRIGLGNDTTATGDYNDGAYFEYTHGTNSGNWQIKTANNSSRTTNNTSTAADTNWHLYTIDMNAAGTSVSFYIDGAEVANSPIATNLPGNTRTFSDTYRIIKSAGTNSRTINMDLITLWIQCSSNRY